MSRERREWMAQHRADTAKIQARQREALRAQAERDAAMDASFDRDMRAWFGAAINDMSDLARYAEDPATQRALRKVNSAYRAGDKRKAVRIARRNRAGIKQAQKLRSQRSGCWLFALTLLATLGGLAWGAVDLIRMVI